MAIYLFIYLQSVELIISLHWFKTSKSTWQLANKKHLMVHAHLISSEATTMTMLMRQTPNMWCRNSRVDRASTTSVHVHDHHQFMVSVVCTLHVREGKSRSQWKKAQAIINCLKKQRNTLNKHIISYIYGIDCYTFHRAVCRYLIMPAQCKSLTSFLFPHQ